MCLKLIKNKTFSSFLYPLGYPYIYPFYPYTKCDIFYKYFCFYTLTIMCISLHLLAGLPANAISYNSQPKFYIIFFFYNYVCYFVACFVVVCFLHTLMQNMLQGPLLNLNGGTRGTTIKKISKKQRTVSGAPGGRKIPLGGFVKQMGFLKPFVGDRRYSYIYLSN